MKTKGQPTALSINEERTIVDTLLRYAHRGYHLEREDLLDCVEILVKNMGEDRRSKLPFKNGRPSNKFARSFERRHRDSIRFGKSSKQEAKRFAATNAENLTSYLAELEAIMRENNIDARRIANLDETGVSPDKDGLGISTRKQYGTRSAPIQQKIAEFTYRHRVTLMSTVFSDGLPACPVFVFKGSRQPYRVVYKNGIEITESLRDCLPRGSLVFHRKDGGGVDKDVFSRWAEHFISEVEYLTAGGRKVLLLYDAYRSDMSFQALTILKSGGIIAFALPAHTSGKTQPLDVGVFQPFKPQLHIAVRRACSPNTVNVFDMFDLCRFMTTAYLASYTVDKIRKAFCNAGIYPFDSSKLIGVPRPLNEMCQTAIITPEEMEVMLEEKREIRRDTISVAPVILSKGYLDTKQGLVLTTDAAMQAICKKEQQDAHKKELQYKKLVCSDVKFVIEAKQRRVERQLFERCRAKRLSQMYNVPFKLPRSLKQRRAVAREKVVMKKARRQLDTFLAMVVVRDATAGCQRKSFVVIY